MDQFSNLEKDQTFLLELFTELYITRAIGKQKKKLSEKRYTFDLPVSRYTANYRKIYMCLQFVLITIIKNSERLHDGLRRNTYFISKCQIFSKFNFLFNRNVFT